MVKRESQGGSAESQPSEDVTKQNRSDKDVSWEEAFNWAKDDAESKRRNSSYKTTYIIVGIVVLIIIITVLYLYYNTSSKVESVILDSINDPKNNIPVVDVATPHPATPLISGRPQSPIIGVTPGIVSSRGNGLSRPTSNSFRRPNIRPSPGGSSLISPNGKLYPAVQDGVQTGWWLKPHGR